MKLSAFPVSKFIRSQRATLWVVMAAGCVSLSGCATGGNYPSHVHPGAYAPASVGTSIPAEPPTYAPARSYGSTAYIQPSTPNPVRAQPRNPNGLQLSDRVSYSQSDPRWGQDRLGRGGGTLAQEGCVVTSASMAMTNAGFPVDPGELNRRLTGSNNLTKSGLLKWKGISEVSGGRVKATFFDTVSEPLIQQCLVKGDYPLVRFYLPNGRSHWAMILGKSDAGYHMRDPLRVSNTPLVFPRDSSAFKSLRCIGAG